MRVDVLSAHDEGPRDWVDCRGFVLGPVYVGVLAGAVGLRGAMVGVALLLAAVALLAPAVTRRSVESTAVTDGGASKTDALSEAEGAEASR